MARAECGSTTQRTVRTAFVMTTRLQGKVMGSANAHLGTGAPCARLERTIGLIISVKNAQIPALIIALFIFGIVVAVIGLYELDMEI